MRGADATADRRKFNANLASDQRRLEENAGGAGQSWLTSCRLAPGRVPCGGVLLKSEALARSAFASFARL
jgi:hypothetical protein